MDQQFCEISAPSKDILIKKFHNEIQGIFSVMVGVEDIMPLPMQVDPITDFENCVTALVGFSGVSNGLLSLHVPESLALQFTSNMLGTETAELNGDVNDALGEIANVMADSFKYHIANNGHEVSLTMPSIITGKEYTIRSGSSEDSLSLLYDSNGEWFLVNVVIEQNQTADLNFQ